MQQLSVDNSYLSIVTDNLKTSFLFCGEDLTASIIWQHYDWCAKIFFPLVLPL
jgi:hypothetical protein